MIGVSAGMIVSITRFDDPFDDPFVDPFVDPFAHLASNPNR